MSGFFGSGPTVIGPTWDREARRKGMVILQQTFGQLTVGITEGDIA